MRASSSVCTRGYDLRSIWIEPACQVSFVYPASNSSQARNDINARIASRAFFFMRSGLFPGKHPKEHLGPVWRPAQISDDDLCKLNLRSALRLSFPFSPGSYFTYATNKPSGEMAGRYASPENVNCLCVILAWETCLILRPRVEQCR